MFSCDKVITIPQYKGTCWFNAILMAIFYSQHSRKLLYHHFEGKKDKFSRIMNDIIKHNYIKTDQAIKYFEFMKPENILKYINIPDKKDLYNIFKKTKAFGYHFDAFLPVFLKNLLNKNVLDVIIYQKECYANIYSLLPNVYTKYYKEDGKTVNIDLAKWSGLDSKDITDPDYIIVNKLQYILDIPDNSSMSSYRKVFYKIFYSMDDKILSKLNLKKNNIDIKGLIDFDDIIFYNNNKYVLDSVLLSNYNNDIGLGHAIAGITCKNTHYVYNGWIRTTNDPGMPKNYGNEKIPCELMKFNWNVKEDNKFCLNPNICKVDEYKEDRKKDLCFSFNNIANITLIYVKDLSITSIDNNITPTSVLTLPSLKSNNSFFSEIHSPNSLSFRKKIYLKHRKDRKKEQDKFKKLLKTTIKPREKPKKPEKEPKERKEKPEKEPRERKEKPEKEPREHKEKPKKEPRERKEKPKKEPKERKEKPEKEPKERKEKPEKEHKERKEKPEKEHKERKEKPEKEPREKPKKPEKEPREKPKKPEKEPKERKEKPIEKPRERKEKPIECNKFTYDTSYIDCLLAALFNNTNLAIEEIFFNIKLTNKYAIAIRDEFKCYYETKTYNKIKLLKAIQIYYNEFNLKNPEYPKIVWAKGKYYFTDLIILLQQIFNFKKNLIEILLSHNEKFKIIDKKQITEIKTIQITKLKPNPELILKSLFLLSAVVVRLDDKYKCFYKCKTKWYDNNNKIIENIDKHLKTEKYKVVSYVYY